MTRATFGLSIIVALIVGIGIALAVAFPDQDGAPTAQPARATASVTAISRERWSTGLALRNGEG